MSCYRRKERGGEFNLAPAAYCYPVVVRPPRFQGLCEHNPVPRGQHGRLAQVLGHGGFVRGLLPRLIKLPDIPTDEQWRHFLSIAAVVYP